MKIELLENIGNLEEGEGLSIIRLFDFDEKEALHFMNDLIQQVMANHQSLDISNASYCQLLNCHLIFELSDSDEGLIRSGLSNTFVCRLTLAAYALMISRIAGFTSGPLNGFQWLHDVISPVSLLFSPDGNW